jgi:penicillin-binding protein 2
VSETDKDPQQREIVKRRHFTFRLNVFFFVIFCLFSILIIRLAVLQFVEADELRALKDRSSFFPYDIPPIRGNIYDINGYPLAISNSTQSLYYQFDSGQSGDEIIALAKRLEQIFRERGNPNQTPMTAEEILKAMDAGVDIKGERVQIINYYSSPRRIKTDLTKEEIAFIMEHRGEFRNLSIVEESVREYMTLQDGTTDENGNLVTTGIAPQLVGYLRQYSTAINHIPYYRETDAPYLDTENVGFDGIELMYEAQLRGIPGSKTYPVDALGQVIGDPIISPATKGNNLYLTIDASIQEAVKKKIVEHLHTLKTDPEYIKVNPRGTQASSAFVAAIEIPSGRVVAMVSYPDYDPNIWRGGKISQADLNKYQRLFNNGAIRATVANFEDDAERNRHPGSMVQLGSTIKPLTVLLGLNEGLITSNSKYQDVGVFTFGRDNSKIKNSGGSAFGLLTAEDAIARSSNTFMAAMIGNPLYMSKGQEALDIWDSYMSQFGLGVSTESGLPGEQAGIKEYFTMAKDSSAQAAMVYSSFGQGGRYTALQLAQYAATLATRGKRIKPQLVDKIVSYDGETVYQLDENSPVVLNEVDLPDAYWDLVQRGMKRVTQQGFDDFPYTLASKTGTSETDVAGGRVENATFIAYAPAENPRLAVAVVVPEGGFGARGAAPIAAEVFRAYDKAFGLAPSDETK